MEAQDTSWTADRHSHIPPGGLTDRRLWPAAAQQLAARATVANLTGVCRRCRGGRRVTRGRVVRSCRPRGSAQGRGGRSLSARVQAVRAAHHAFCDEVAPGGCVGVVGLHRRRASPVWPTRVGVSLPRCRVSAGSREVAQPSRPPSRTGPPPGEGAPGHPTVRCRPGPGVLDGRPGNGYHARLTVTPTWPARRLRRPRHLPRRRRPGRPGTGAARGPGLPR